MKKKMALVAALSLVLVVAARESGWAQGAGTTWLACRQTAYSNYMNCLSAGSGYWDNLACYIAGSLDMVTCDVAAAKGLVY